MAAVPPPPIPGPPGCRPSAVEPAPDKSVSKQQRQSARGNERRGEGCEMGVCVETTVLIARAKVLRCRTFLPTLPSSPTPLQKYTHAVLPCYPSSSKLTFPASSNFRIRVRTELTVWTHGSIPTRAPSGRLVASQSSIWGGGAPGVRYQWGCQSSLKRTGKYTVPRITSRTDCRLQPRGET